jgi:hypothetical protein
LTGLDQAGIQESLSQQWLDQNRVLVVLIFSSVISLIFLAMNLFLVGIAALMLYMTKGSPVTSIETYKESINLILNALSLPTFLAMAYGLENVFDGKREVLGSKIDLTGYSDTVKVKLRRMRYDTSNFVSGIMQGYNISSGWRIMLELVPSLFLYSRNRRLTGKDNLISDENYKKAMQDLQ